MNDRESRERRDRTRRRRKKAVFDPKADRNPLSDLFGETKSKAGDSKPAVRPETRRTKPPPERPAKKEYEILDGIDPMELFAAYHLGLTREGEYRPQNIHDVARRFHSTPARIKEILAEYDLGAESVMEKDFDMGLAQLDIKVAPEGIDRAEIARQLYDEFREAPRIARNWDEELARDAEENRKIFEKLK